MANRVIALYRVNEKEGEVIITTSVCHHVVQPKLENNTNHSIHNVVVTSRPMTT